MSRAETVRRQFGTIVLLAVGFFLWYARQRESFYFLLVAVIYGYIGVTHMLFRLMTGADTTVYLLYFILSCVGIIVFLTRYKQFFKNSTL